MSAAEENSDCEIKIEEILSGEKNILKLSKKLIISSDLDVLIGVEINEVHIVCDTLQVCGDLPESYRGKNILIVAEIIQIDKESKWNLSGENASSIQYYNDFQNSIDEENCGLNGESGSDGGNCEIICDKIINSSLWTIESNGGDGLNGRNAVDGKNGQNGRDAQLDDFQIADEEITTSNFGRLIKKLNISTDFGSRRKTYYENGLEKLVIFNKDSSMYELLVLVKGSKGKPGELGGFGGQGGRGGKAGKVNKKLKIIARNGKDGISGINGFNGQNGKDGRDAFMILRNDGNQPIHGGLSQRSKFKVSVSISKTNNSIYYKPLNKFLCVSEIQEIHETIQPSRNTSEALSARVTSYEHKFYKALVSTLKNSNEFLYEVTKKLKMEEFASQKITSRNFVSEIIKNDFDVPYYDILKDYASFFLTRPLRVEGKIREVLHDFTKNQVTLIKSEDIYEMKKNLMTSEDLEEVPSNFKELHVICDVLHVNTNLSEKFRGKNLAIYANTIHVHYQTEWDLSGQSKTTKWPGKAGQDSSGKGNTGVDGESGDSGGNCSIKCESIINPSLWTINLNGGNGSSGQDGGDGRDSINGTNPGINDFEFDERDIGASSLTFITKKWIENNLEKEIFVESKDTYLMIVKGSNGKHGMAGGPSGYGGREGLAGKIDIEIADNDEACEVQILASNGNKAKDGVPGKCGDISFKDGFDVVLYVKNGIKEYIGLNGSHKYEICQSNFKRDYSIFVRGSGCLYYFPKQTAEIKETITRSDDLSFYENLVPVLRNSYEDFDKLIEKLQLEKFVNNRILLHDIAKIISKHDFMIPHYNQLKRITSEYKVENHQIHNFIREKIAEFLKPIEITTSSNIVEIKKKVLKSSEFTSLSFNNNIQEIRVICDTLHINSDLTVDFRGKSLTIATNYIDVHSPTTWDLSGLSENSESFGSNAGQDENGNGKNGSDGNAGENGGTFTLQCKFIENPSFLEIISNGTNGMNGQDGGNGRNGKDGKNAEKSDFFVGEIPMKMPMGTYYYAELKKSSNCSLHFENAGYSRLTYKTNNGLHAFLHIRPAIVMVLVKGEVGEDGKTGGLGGYGGEAGVAGKIDIKYDSFHGESFIKTRSNAGKSGKNGQNGWNGIRGRDGRDLGKYDYSLYSAPAIFGEDVPRKLKIEKVEGEKWKALLTLGSNQLTDYSLFSNEKQIYLQILNDEEIVKPSSTQTRNDSTLSRSKMSRATVRTKPSINANAIKQKSSHLLNESIDDISSEISQFNRKSMTAEKKSTSTVSTPTAKSEIDMDTIRSEHENFLATSLSEVAEVLSACDEKNSLDLSHDERHHLVEKLQISTTRQVNFVNKKKKKLRKRRIQPLRESSDILNYELLRSTKAKKTATECLEFLRKSRLNVEQYQFLIKNVQKLNIEDDGRKMEILNSAADYLKQLIIKEYEAQDENECSNVDFNQNPQILKIINDLASNSQYNFVRKALNDIQNESKLTISDVQSICEEKNLLLFYKDIYKKVNQIDVTNEKLGNISFDSTDFSNQFMFLKDSKDFSSGSEELDKYFNNNLEKERKEIFKYFDDKCKKFQFSFSESIFNHLVDNADKYKEIAPILKKFVRKTNEVDEKLESFNKFSEDTLINELEMESLVKENESKRSEFNEILKQFYDTKELQKFIKNDLMKNGIDSSLYRHILAYKFGIKLVFCRQSIDNKLKVFEWHNYGHDLRFDYEDDEMNKDDNIGMMAKMYNKISGTFPFRREQQDVPAENESMNAGFLSKMYSVGKGIFKKQEQKEIKAEKEPNESAGKQEIFILSEYKKFSVLNFEKEKYKNFKSKEKYDKDFKEVALILENFGDDKMKSQNYFDEKLIEIINECAQKFQMVDNMFANIFQNNGILDDEKFLFESAMLSFPQSSLSLEIDDQLSEDGIEDAQAFSKLQTIHRKVEDEVRMKVKWLFVLIAKLGGISILKAITIRLFNETSSQHLEDFLIFMKTIFTILLRKQGFVMPMTFMILGNEQENWVTELILMKIDSLLGMVNHNTHNKWKKILDKSKMSKILPIFLDKICQLDKAEDHELLDVQDFDHIFDNLNYFDDDNSEILAETNLNTWGLMTTDKYWNIHLEKLKQYNKYVNEDFEEIKTIFEDMSNKYGLKTRKLMDIFHEKNKELSNIDLADFLENFNSGKWTFGDKILKYLKKTLVSNWSAELNKYFSSEIDTRNAEIIAQTVKSDDETSLNIKENMYKIEFQIHDIFNVESEVKDKRFLDFEEDEILHWLRTSKSSADVVESLAIISRVFKLKNNVTLRDTQLASILTMWNSDDGILMQVSTGEGKTFIAVAFAILKVLKGEKVDIITSSSVLAERDAVNKENRKIFDFFNIKVDHNCHQKSDTRKEAYKCDIVYGTLCNFQRDYLLTEFHEQELMSGHHFKNILVDEVDSMLLDKGNNILYLSQDLPDLDEVESVFIFIWQWVNQNFNDLEEASQIFSTDLIRKIVLDNAYGILDEDDVSKMKLNVDAQKVIKILKDLKVIDKENLITEEYFDEQKVSSALSIFGVELTEKINLYCRDKIKSEKQVRFPKYLKNFVLHHLDKWIENAIRALYLENENQYVINRANAGVIDDYPDINILDLDTGTTMSNSQWDEGLHQFLQLKYGCKLSPLSLKSVFISNVSFFKKYKKLYGMTGTLGNLQERQKITKIHQIDFVTIPRYMTRNFVEYSPISESNKDDWKNKICEEVKTMLNNGRSVLVICETIQETLSIQKAISDLVPKEKLHVYRYDTDIFDINELLSGHVIISTNLAGRGTDIKLSRDLSENGGLHVILTNLPDNSRIEEQAFGRAARCGEKGSGRLIISSNALMPISKLKEARNQNELKRLDEISTYYENFIKIEEEFFDKFQLAYRELKKESSNEEAYLLNFLIQWSFWLDGNSKLLDDWKQITNQARLQESFKKFLSDKKVLHPIMRVELFKELIGKDKKCDVRNVLDDHLQTDLFAHQYFKLYEMMRRNQMENSYNIRELKNEEQRQIRICYKMLQSSINNRNVRIQCVKYLKENYQKNAPPIEGFENQQSEILDIFSEISKNLKSLLGEDINPESLGTTLIDKEIMRNDLYEELLRQKCIRPPQVSKFYSDEDIAIISKKHKIKFSDLKTFLVNHRSTKINSLKEFGENLKGSFKLSSRTEFWKVLVNKKILTNEIEYAIVDMNAIKDVDPSAGEQLEKKFQSEKLSTSSNWKVFFASVNEIDNNRDEQQEKGKLVLKMEVLKSEFSKDRFDYLMKNDIIEVNKEAHFNMEKFNNLKNTKLFDNFDEIKRDDFKDVCRNYDKIIRKLSSADLNILIPRSLNTFGINYENFEKISNPYDLDDDFVYHSKIYELLREKFSYKIALEKLVDDLSNPINTSTISLDIDPHMNLLNDLLTHMIIEQAKVDETKIENCHKIFNDSTVSNILKQAGLTVDDELLKDMRDKKLISYWGPINNFDINTAKLSKKYQNIESTVKLLLQNRRILMENTENIKNNLKNFMKPLRNKELSELEVVLVPIEKFLPRNNFLHFMELKSLGVIIKVQQQMYSTAYWIRFSTVLAFALLQIVAGVAITLMFKGLAYKIGSTLINEGTSDAIFALSSLRTGNFSWSDYRKHKIISVATSVVLLTGEIGFSKLKWFKKAAEAGKETTAIGATIGGTLSETTGSELVKEYGKIGVNKVIRETAFKTVISCKNVLIQAGVGMAVDAIIKQFLNQVTEKIGGEIVNWIKKDFNSHQVSSTIDGLLNFYKTDALRSLIIEKFQQAQSNSEFYRDIASRVSSGVDTIIRSDQNTFRSIAFVTSLVAKVVDISMVTYFVRRMYDNLNDLLANVLNTIRNSEYTEDINNEDAEKFKKNILEHIQHEATIQYRNSLNSTVVKPALMYAGTMITKNIINSIENTIKGSILKHREKKLMERTIKVVEMIEKHKATTNSEEIPEELLSEAMSILASTKNPELYKTLIKQNIPMDTIGIECVRLVLEKKFGQKFKFVIKHKGHEHEYGNTNDPNVKTIELDLVNNHFKNGSNITSGNDCLHYAIGEKYPELLNQMTPEQLRNAVSNEIDTNQNVKSAISSYDKEFYLEIGLYGGKEGEKRRGRKKTWTKGQKTGTYYQVSRANPERKGKREVHHVPATAAQKDTPYGEESRGKQSAILLDREVHRRLSSTGNSVESQDFIKTQNELLKDGLRDEALVMDHRDRHNVEVEVRSQRREEGYEFEESSSTYMNEVHNDMRDQIDYEHRAGKIDDEQRDYARGEIDKLANSKRSKVNVRGEPVIQENENSADKPKTKDNNTTGSKNTNADGSGRNKEQERKDTDSNSPSNKENYDQTRQKPKKDPK